MIRVSMSKTKLVLIFVTLEIIAIHFIFINSLYKSQLDELVSPMCSQGTTIPIFRQVTGIQPLDRLLCVLVSFFQPAIHPTPLPILRYFLGNHGPLVIVPFVESKRPTISFPASSPTLAWVTYQLVTIGVGVPWYWAGFILSGDHTTNNGRISRLDAESTLFGFLFGSALPFLAMVYLDNPYATAVWQAFPLFVAALRLVYFRVRKQCTKKCLESEDGSQIVEVVYLTLFLVGAYTHLHTFETLRLGQLLHPSFPVSTVREGVDLFLKWDLVMGFATSMIASCWFAARASDLMILVLWNGLGGYYIGPSAVLSGTFLWRERYLRCKRQKQL